MLKEAFLYCFLLFSYFSIFIEFLLRETLFGFSENKNVVVAVNYSLSMFEFGNKG